MKLYSLSWWITFMLSTYFLIIYNYNLIVGQIETSFISAFLINLGLIGLGNGWMLITKDSTLTDKLGSKVAKLIFLGLSIIGFTIFYFS